MFPRIFLESSSKCSLQNPSGERPPKRRLQTRPSATLGLRRPSASAFGLPLARPSLVLAMVSAFRLMLSGPQSRPQVPGSRPRPRASDRSPELQTRRNRGVHWQNASTRFEQHWSLCIQNSIGEIEQHPVEQGAIGRFGGSEGFSHR